MSEKLSRRTVLTGLGAALGLVSAAIVVNRLAHNGRVAEVLDQQAPPVDTLPDGTPVFNRTADILNWESLALADGKAFKNMVQRIKDQMKLNSVTYHNLRGETVGATLVAGLPRGREKAIERQEWHNKNRKQIHGPEGVALPTDPDLSGYPFELVPRLGDVGVVKDRLLQSAKGPDYFGGKPIILWEGFRRIAEEYGVPFELLLGFGATESAFDPDVPDSKPEQGPPAKGIFQFLDWVAEAQAIPFLKPKTSYRPHAITKYNSHNRFLQAECFCAHFLFLKEKMQPTVVKLTQRMQEIDPRFTLDLSDLVTLTAYNGGAELAAGAVDRFVALSDAQIKRRLGEHLTTEDVWLAALAYSYGQKFKVAVDKDGHLEDRTVGSQVFHYPARVKAWKQMLSS